MGNGGTKKRKIEKEKRTGEEPRQVRAMPIKTIIVGTFKEETMKFPHMVWGIKT